MSSIEEEEDGRGSDSRDRSDASSSSPPMRSSDHQPRPRRCRDVICLFVFVVHLLALGSLLALIGINRFNRADRLNIDRFTNITSLTNQTVQIDRPEGLTETFWPLYGAACGVGVVLAFVWLSVLGTRAVQMMRVSVHSLTTYLAVLSVLCFWGEYFFWGVAFAVGATLQFLYVMSVMDR